MRATITSKGRRVTATYEGGAYIDLAFGDHTQATEVINVWDYETSLPEGDLALLSEIVPGAADIPQKKEKARAALRVAVLDWIASNDEEWPEWYDGYMENARVYS